MKILSTALATLAGLLLVVILAVAFNTARLPDAVLQPADGSMGQVRTEAIDAAAVAERLAEAIRFETVSGRDSDTAFLALHRWMETTYPEFHGATEREVFNRYSLLYRWPGRGGCDAAGFIAHLDVVPIEQGTLEGWTHPPFAGVIADGFVWGRGAVDTKDNLVLVLEAAERLAAQGFQPHCDLYFIFGHDEEVGGRDGAGVMAAALAERGVRFAWLLDEAGGVDVNLDGSTIPPMVTIGVSSQGFMTLELTARAPGGHSASGVEDTAITRLAEAVLALQQAPMPMRLEGVAERDVRARAAGGPWTARMLAANLWLLRPVAESQIRAHDGLGMLRTTMAATVIEGGERDNVLPQIARARINARVHPRTTLDQVASRVREVVGDGIEVRVLEPADPPTRPVSPDHPAFRLVAESVADVLGPIRVVPAFGFGTSDGRYFQDVTDAILNFDFMPLEASSGAHDTDERLDTRYLAHGVAFHQLLMARHGAPP